MKTHTSDFKTNIAQIGKQITSKIIYTISGTTIELGDEELNSITPHYKGDILKSVMKQLDIDSNIDIPIGTTINYQFGLKIDRYIETEDSTYQNNKNYYSYVNNEYTLLVVGTDYNVGDNIVGTIYEFQEYEYLDYGNYIVNKSEKQEDVNSYKITCYDKMLYSMVDYVDLGITYPITIRNYINAICTHLGLTFANSNNTFTNYDKEIPSELYLDSEGNSLKYTFRDVLDQLAQVTASTICINDNDELEIRYISNAGEETTTVEGTNISIQDNKDTKVNDLQLKGNTSQKTTSGKNLLNPNGNSGALNNLTFTNNGDGTFTINGTASANTTFSLSSKTITLEANQKYTQTLEVLSGDLGSASIVPAFKNSGGTITYNYFNCNKNSVADSKTPTDTMTSHTYNIYIASGVATTNCRFRVQLEKGNSTTYEPYTNGPSPNPDYPQDIHNITGDNTIRVCGKNLLDILTYPFVQTTGTLKTNIPNFKAGTYTFSFEMQNTGGNQVTARKIVGGTTTQITYKYNAKSLTFTLDEDATLQLEIYKSGLVLSDVSNAQLEKGNQATTYEQYIGQDYTISLGTTELCKIGNYQDKIFKNTTDSELYNSELELNAWYINKNIGKVVLDGSENWADYTTQYTNYYMSYCTTKHFGRTGNMLSADKFIINNFQSQGPAFNVEKQFITSSVYAIYLKISSSIVSTANDLKTWLGNNNAEVYYELATPTYTKITDSTLISQLESIRLLEELNNITTDVPLKLTYVSGIDTIDEEYFKDINVNFGEKYGPINSIVLSRSAGADNIYRQDENSITQNGLCELKIEDNQILNDNERDQYIDGIFNQLNGLEYYINDYSSYGILYYDLCDRYIAKIDDNTYKCIMFNDEVNVEQGLEENIYTDMPIVSETEYKYADTTDKQINQAYIIVDKQTQTIENLTSRTQTLENDNDKIKKKFDSYTPLSNYTTLKTTVDTIQTDTYKKTEVKQILKGQFYDENNNQIVSEIVKTTSGTFDENGMLYEKSGSPVKTRINDVGTRTSTIDGDKTILFAGYVDNNNTEYADYKGQTIVATENVIVKNYFVMPEAHSRIEKYGNGGGMFYV